MSNDVKARVINAIREEAEVITDGGYRERFKAKAAELLRDLEDCGDPEPWELEVVFEQLTSLASYYAAR